MDQKSSAKRGYSLAVSSQMIKMSVRINYRVDLQPMLLHDSDYQLYITTRIDNYTFTAFFARNYITVD
jgi:hypothetical protein